MKRRTGDWVRKAEADWVIAQQFNRSKYPLHDGTCFHCQQCAEQYLKALLEELGRRIPRTHILKDILSLLRPDYPFPNSYLRGLTYLTRFAVETRYPGDSANNRQATAALRWTTPRARYPP